MTTRALVLPARPAALACHCRGWPAGWRSTRRRRSHRHRRRVHQRGVALLAIVGNVFTRQVLGFSLVRGERVGQLRLPLDHLDGRLARGQAGGGHGDHARVGSRAGWWQRSVRGFSGISLGIFLAYALLADDPVRPRRRLALGGDLAPWGSPGSTRWPRWPSATTSSPSTTYSRPSPRARGAGGERGLWRAGRRLAGGRADRRGPLGDPAGAAGAGRRTAGRDRCPVRGADPGRHPDRLHAGDRRHRRALLPVLPRTDLLSDTDAILPFSVSQFTMGLSGGSELLVILMFLIVAEVLNSSGMSMRLIAFAASLVAHLRGGMAYVCQLTSMVVSGISGLGAGRRGDHDPAPGAGDGARGLPPRRGRRGGRGCVDQGADRPTVDHVHRLRGRRAGPARRRRSPGCCCRG